MDVLKIWHSVCLIRSIMLIFATTSTVNAGDNAWVLVSAALVLVMCIPGLFLFYGGLVRSKNVLSIAAQPPAASNPVMESRLMMRVFSSMLLFPLFGTGAILSIGAGW